MMETNTYRIRMEIQGADGAFRPVATLERVLPRGSGGELLRAIFAACEAIEERENLPGPAGGLSE